MEDISEFYESKKRHACEIQNLGRKRDKMVETLSLPIQLLVDQVREITAHKQPRSSSNISYNQEYDMEEIKLLVQLLSCKERDLRDYRLLEAKKFNL